MRRASTFPIWSSTGNRLRLRMRIRNSRARFLTTSISPTASCVGPRRTIVCTVPACWLGTIRPVAGKDAHVYDGFTVAKYEEWVAAERRQVGRGAFRRGDRLRQRLERMGGRLRPRARPGFRLRVAREHAARSRARTIRLVRHALDRGRAHAARRAHRAGATHCARGTRCGLPWRPDQSAEHGAVAAPRLGHGGARSFFWRVASCSASTRKWAGPSCSGAAKTWRAELRRPSVVTTRRWGRRRPSATRS